MKIFLSSTESSGLPGVQKVVNRSHDKDPKLLWNLVSYYYCQKTPEAAEYIRDNSRLVMVDSGAHTFQHGKKVDWLDYTKRYAQFIREFDRPNVVGYFEMDVDNMIGIDNVVMLRKVLEQETGLADKIIPVWHEGRGNEEFTKMCQEREGRIVAISGFANSDIRDENYASFLKEAWKYGCKLHGLGLTRKKVLDKVPFDYVDSSSWNLELVYGNIRLKDGQKAKLSKNANRGEQRVEALAYSYESWMRIQKDYWFKWRKVCNDQF